MATHEALMITPRDNVATSLGEVEPESEVRVRLGKEVRTIRALEKIPFGFKIAVERIAKGSSVTKYGEPIGVASVDIESGQLVHIHNVEGARGRGDLERGASK